MGTTLWRGLPVGVALVSLSLLGGCGLVVCQADKDECPPASANGRVLVDSGATVAAGGERTYRITAEYTISLRLEVEADFSGSRLTLSCAVDNSSVSCEPVRLEGPGRKQIVITLEKGQSVAWTIRSDGADPVAFRTKAAYVDFGACGLCLVP